MVLTDAWLRANTRNKRPSAFTMSDLQSQNPTVHIATSGRTTVQWRGRSEGKSQTIKLGTFSPHSLAAARAWADAKTVARDKGVAIVTAVRVERQAKVDAETDAARTGRASFEVYMRFDGNRGKDGGKEERSKFECLVLPVIGDRLIADISADDLGEIVAGFVKKRDVAGRAFRPKRSAMREHDDAENLDRWKCIRSAIFWRSRGRSTSPAPPRSRTSRNRR